MVHYGCYIVEYLIVHEALNKQDVLFISVLTHDPSNVAAVDCVDQRVLVCVHTLWCICKCRLNGAVLILPLITSLQGQ